MIEYDDVVAECLDTSPLSPPALVTGKSPRTGADHNDQNDDQNDDQDDDQDGAPRPSYPSRRRVTGVTILHFLGHSARMHSMEKSASTRERRRQETEHRIGLAALRLTEAYGLDGFTMEDLAEAAEVSRRTLFNYFPSKLDAVLGNPPEIPPDVMATFHAGGPHGHLVDDLGVLVRVILEGKDITREEMVLGRRVITGEPRLMVAVHARFEDIATEFVDVILAREGQGFGADRALLLIRLLVAIFDGCLPESELAPERSLADLFDESLRTARELLA